MNANKISNVSVVLAVAAGGILAVWLMGFLALPEPIPAFLMLVVLLGATVGLLLKPSH